MKIECPHCGQHYEVDEEYIGQIANCISCNQEFVIEKIRPDDDIQEKKEKQPAETSTEKRTISMELTKIEEKCPWVWYLFLFFCIFLLINSCSDSSKTPKPKGPPTNAEWVRYFNKVKAEEEKKEQKLWDDIRNY